MKKEQTEKQKEKARLRAKEWYHKNKERAKQTKKEYRENNPEKCRESYKKWAEENKDKLSKNSKKFAKNNREKLNMKSREYRKNNSDKIYERTKNWRKSNPDKVKEWNKNYYYEIKHIKAWRQILSNTLSKFNKEKEGHTIDLLGYSAEELKTHIESLFTEGMSWDNHGEWHIDHIKRVSEFDKETPMNIVNALSNLRPLWATTREINGVIYEGNLNRG
jgi:hypothetical protein